MNIPFLSTVILSVIICGFTTFAEEQNADAYPLKTCVVSGKSLDSMGGAYIYKHNDREVRFCCKRCVKTFLKDPEAHLAKIDDAGKKTGSSENVETKKADHDHHGKHQHHE